MKNRVIKLTPKFITDALQGKSVSVASNLPNNIELLDLRYDLFSNQILAVIRSDNFQDLAENQPTPEFKLTFASASMTQPKPETSPEIMKTPNTRIQQSPTTGKIEEEFSPEQRKLLNFKTENEQVIIKPTQFLKAEWEDINETVRSLGGRWVKGDIISYWVIPI
jgi:hypothetical protein